MSLSFIVLNWRSVRGLLRYNSWLFDKFRVKTGRCSHTLKSTNGFPANCWCFYLNQLLKCVVSKLWSPECATRIRADLYSASVEFGPLNSFFQSFEDRDLIDDCFPRRLFPFLWRMNFHTQFNYNELIIKPINLLILQLNDELVNPVWKKMTHPYVFCFLMLSFKEAFNKWVFKWNHRFVVRLFSV